MKQRVPVSGIMAKNVVTVNVTNSLAQAKYLFKQHKIRHIPVVSGKKIIGMLSYADLLRISFVDSTGQAGVEAYDMFTIEQVMVKNIVSISPETTIKEAAEILATNEFHALPVCEGDELVGILTTTDLIKYLISQY